MNKLQATRAAYGDYLLELGEKDERIVVLDADLSCATMTKAFSEKYPDRFFNAGIAEANMISMAAGLSRTGLIPICSTFAMFGVGRAYEQVRNSIAYPHFNVKLAMTHAGITVGEDGGSHQAIEDLALMRVIPGMTILVPSDANETKKVLDAALKIDGPVYIRLARLESPVLEERDFILGKASVVEEGRDLLVLTCGIMLAIVLKVAERLKEEGYSLEVVNMATIKPLDKAYIREASDRFNHIITVEEHSIIGGLGDAVAGELASYRNNCLLTKIGVEDRFGQSGKPEDLLEEYGLSEEKVYKKIKDILKGE